jgi:hypothetical protein
VRETGKLRRQCGVFPTVSISVVSGGKTFRIEKAGLVGFCAVWLGNGLPMFRSKIPPPSSELQVRELTHKPEDEGGIFLGNFGKKFSNHTAQPSRRLGSSTVTR